jgi:hypothetical protein
MSLVKCPDCCRAVSARAPSCPGCGAPMAPTVTERTGKPVKVAMISFAVLAFICLVLYIVDPATEWLVLTIIGFGGMIGAHAVAWWRHG